MRWLSALGLLLAPLLVLVDAVVLKASSARVGSATDGFLLSISGMVMDAQHRALRGVTVRFDGSRQASTTTDENGNYSFRALTGDATGPWSVQASRAGCTFAPVTLQVMSGSRSAIADLVGSGERCVGSPIRVRVRPNTPVDPGPRPGAPGAGGPMLYTRDRAAERAASVACLPGLSPAALSSCARAFLQFQETVSVSGTIASEEGVGLGPAFSGNSCAMCHLQPAVLGSSSSPLSPQRPLSNPQVELATLDGAKNSVPPFITADGPIRTVLFKNDGEAHALYTIAGRSDASGCAQEQPDFTRNLEHNNVRYRIPLALFGLGLVEAVPESTLRANLAASRSVALGIAGTLNTLSSGGALGRFGWKAQNHSILIFAAEAYSTDIGVTNELFPQERSATPGCALNGSPEDSAAPGKPSELSDIQSFALAIRLSAPPTPAPPPGVSRASLSKGESQFTQLGCANCHTPALTTGKSNIDPALSEVTIHPYSDFALHHMGTDLADGISQGSAGPDQFRTTPLWGLGQRLFFLHDGRTSDLLTAIAAHVGAGSEANAAVANFELATPDEQQDLLSFLRSL